MQLKPILMTLFGLVLAGGSVLVSEGVLNKSNNAAAAASPQAEVQMVKVIVAVADIPFGDEITRDLLTSQQWPAASVPMGAFNDGTALLGPDGTAPRRATRAFRAGDVIIEDSVSRFGATVTLTSALEDGFRAIAIRVSAETAVGGFVSTGDNVDIVLTQGRGETLRTGTIMQNVRVLGVDQNSDDSSRGSTEARTITVQVTPRDGQILALSQQAGILSLTLRNDTIGLADTDLEQITMDDVWGIAEALPAPVAAQPVPVVIERTVTVRRGVDEQNVVLP